MRLIIQGKSYPLNDAVQRASLNNLYAMTAQTGIGMIALTEGMQAIDKVGIDQAFDNPELLAALRCLIFLARRYAGEPHTVESACDFPMLEMGLEEDPDDMVVDADDPTSAPTGSDQAAVVAKAPRKTRTRNSSTTSGKPSTTV